MADVFLSYAREDREKAEQLAKVLGACWSVWWDRDIAPGDAWADVIERELAGARVVIVLWSKHSRTANYVREEATEALEQKKLVRPTCASGRG